MCIRDSYWAAKVKPGRIMFEIDGVSEVIAREALRLGAMKPVSYTHLRAHETVLDLVCRLLLEKKNNNKHTTIIMTLVTT